MRLPESAWINTLAKLGLKSVLAKRRKTTARRCAFEMLDDRIVLSASVTLHVSDGATVGNVVLTWQDVSNTGVFLNGDSTTYGFEGDRFSASIGTTHYVLFQHVDGAWSSQHVNEDNGEMWGDNVVHYSSGDAAQQFAAELSGYVVSQSESPFMPNPPIDPGATVTLHVNDGLGMGDVVLNWQDVRPQGLWFGSSSGFGFEGDLGVSHYALVRADDGHWFSTFTNDDNGDMWGG